MYACACACICCFMPGTNGLTVRGVRMISGCGVVYGISALGYPQDGKLVV